MPRSRFVASAALLLTAGCATTPNGEDQTQALLAADRAWAQVASAGGNADSVLSFWTDDARVAIPGAPVVAGKAALREMVKRDFGTPGFHVTWTPERAVVAQSGDIGYTVGNNEFTVPDSAGHPQKFAGRYLTVWRKGPDGRWRCAEDYSSPAPAK